AMGLILEDNQVAILSDILGMEDHLGDMDFKVAGTKDGVTALQMDIKIGGVTPSLMRQALAQAKDGRLWILEKMESCLSSPRSQLAAYAPRITTLQIKQDKIREVIGPGGKVIRNIISECGVKVNVDDSGVVTIAAVDGASAQKATDMIMKLVEEVEVGKIYLGTVKKIVDFGAFVEILPNLDGLVHISQLAPHRVQSVADEISEGEQILVKVLEVDRQGKVRLSRKEAMAERAELTSESA
ncbi:MAG: S1 RNA-binding domain-containing protein, partial [Nitrospira sp.]|nr:S1 RNA-binding domain-containing protein [Nitrospira sp.]